MSHSHSHGEVTWQFFFEQLCTILVAGALGTVAVLMYQLDILKYILVQAFWGPVLYGGIAILIMSVIRAIALWQLAGQLRGEIDEEPAHDHGHSHNHSHAHSHKEDCEHDHAPGEKCEHDHAHGAKHNEEDDHHDHSFAPWRYAVLVFPIALSFLPNSTFSNEMIERDLAGASKIEVRDNRKLVATLAGGGVYTVKKKGTMVVKFNTLSTAAARASEREYYEGQTAKLKGQFWPYTDKEFTLFRMRMTCCAADSIPLKVRIICQQPVQSLQSRQWVEVEGEVMFVQSSDKKEWIPVLLLQSDSQITPIPPENNEYESLD